MNPNQKTERTVSLVDGRVASLTATIQNNHTLANEANRLLQSTLKEAISSLTDSLHTSHKSLKHKLTQTTTMSTDALTSLNQTVERLTAELKSVVANSKYLEDTVRGEVKSRLDADSKRDKSVRDQLSGLEKQLIQGVTSVDRSTKELIAGMDIKLRGDLSGLETKRRDDLSSVEQKLRENIAGLEQKHHDWAARVDKKQSELVSGLDRTVKESIGVSKEVIVTTETKTREAIAAMNQVTRSYIVFVLVG